MPLKRKHTICSKDEVYAKASDFVFSYEDVRMISKRYTVDDSILGEGNLNVCFITFVCRPIRQSVQVQEEGGWEAVCDQDH